MGKKQEEKLRKLNKIYANGVKNKTVTKATAKKQNETTVRDEEIEDETEDEIEEDETNRDERKLEIMALFDGDNAGSISGESNRKAERKMSLPNIPQARPASQRSCAAANTGMERTISLPMINERKNIVSESLKLERDDKGDARSEKISLKDLIANRNARQLNVATGIKEDGNVQKPLQTPPKSSSKPAADQGGKEESQAEKDLRMLEKLLKNIEENEGTSEVDKNNKKGGMFRRAANATINAKKFSNILVQDLNLRYLQAVYFEPDYNDKYKRLNTPDIETDEEKDADILQDMHDDGSTSGGRSDTEGGNDSSSSSPTESDQNESDTDRNSPDKV